MKTPPRNLSELINMHAASKRGINLEVHESKSRKSDLSPVQSDSAVKRNGINSLKPTGIKIQTKFIKHKKSNSEFQPKHLKYSTSNNNTDRQNDFTHLLINPNQTTNLLDQIHNNQQENEKERNTTNNRVSITFNNLFMKPVLNPMGQNNHIMNGQSRSEIGERQSTTYRRHSTTTSDEALGNDKNSYNLEKKSKSNIKERVLREKNNYQEEKGNKQSFSILKPLNIRSGDVGLYDCEYDKGSKIEDLCILDEVRNLSSQSRVKNENSEKDQVDNKIRNYSNEIRMPIKNHHPIEKESNTRMSNERDYYTRLDRTTHRTSQDRKGIMKGESMNYGKQGRDLLFKLSSSNQTEVNNNYSTGQNKHYCQSPDQTDNQTSNFKSFKKKNMKKFIKKLSADQLKISILK